MTYLIYQADLNCCAMRKPSRLTVVYGSTTFPIFLPLAFYHKQEKNNTDKLIKYFQVANM